MDYLLSREIYQFLILMIREQVGPSLLLNNRDTNRNNKRYQESGLVFHSRDYFGDHAITIDSHNQIFKLACN